MTRNEFSESACKAADDLDETLMKAFDEGYAAGELKGQNDPNWPTIFWVVIVSMVVVALTISVAAFAYNVLWNFIHSAAAQ